MTGVEALVRLGFRYFSAPAFSIDPAIFFGGGYFIGGYPYGAVNSDTHSSEYTLGLSVALSGWIAL
jgi:hypothetical protein